MYVLEVDYYKAKKNVYSIKSFTGRGKWFSFWSRFYKKFLQWLLILWIYILIVQGPLLLAYSFFQNYMSGILISTRVFVRKGGISKPETGSDKGS